MIPIYYIRQQSKNLYDDEKAACLDAIFSNGVLFAKTTLKVVFENLDISKESLKHNTC